MSPASATAIAADASVEAGRQALNPWAGGYPWYDSATDDVRRIEVSEPVEWDPEPFSWMPDLASIMQFLAWTVLIALAAVLVYLLVRALRDRIPEGSAAASRAGTADAGDSQRVEALPFPVEPGKLNLLAEARRHREAGNYSRAIVYLFSFQLVQLDRRQVIRLSRGKTNRQYVREIRSPILLQQLIEQTMIAFEDAFFGNHTLERSRFESCWSRLDEFESLATAASGT